MAIRTSKKDTGANLGFEAKLWAAADALRNNVDATEEDGEPFDEKMRRLASNLTEQFAEGARLDQAIREDLAMLGFPLENEA